MTNRKHECARVGDGRHGRDGQTTGHAMGAAQTQCTAPRRWPPYARRTAHHPGPDARVVVGRCGWDAARAVLGRAVLVAVLPDGDDPAGYDWTGLVGREVRVSWWSTDGTPADVVRRLALALVHAGARLVVAVVSMIAHMEPLGDRDNGATL